MKTIPSNRRILLEKRIEKERKLDLKEAREKIWSKWRQNKGKKTHFPKLKTKGSKEALEDKLQKVEAEIESYKKELEKIEAEKEKRENKLKKKERKLKHWEMMKWIVAFIDENKEEWDKIKRMKKEDREKQEERDNWEMKSGEEK